MPQVSREFEINGTLLDSWNLMNDPMALGGCIPGCEQVSVLNETESRWKLKISVGVISRRIEARARVTQREAPGRLVLKIESLDGEINGEFELSLTKRDEATTGVGFRANVDARGPFQWIVNQVIKSQMDKFVGQFADCVSAKIAKP